MLLALFLVGINALKLWLARFLPLLGDEAYYHLWSKHLALSYNDHPPVIAYLHWLVNFLLGQNETSIRLAAIICLLISSWLIYLIGKEAYNKKVGTAAVVLFNLIPTFFVGGLFLTPEQPLIIFWLLSTYWLLKLIKTQKKIFWYLLGLSLGLGLLSKYPMFLFLPGLLLFLSISKENRCWLTKKELYFSLILAFLLFLPVIIWNWQQGFSSLAHHGARLGSQKYLENIVYFFILQFIMYSPFLFIYTFRKAVFGFWKKLDSLDAPALLLFSLSLPAFLIFLLASPFTMIGGHWTSVAYLCPVVLLCHQFYAKPGASSHLWLALASIILINALFIGYYAFLYPVPAEIKGDVYSLNKQLPAYINRAKVDCVFSNQMGVASLVAFYGRTEVHMPKGLWKQFDLWEQPELKQGDDLLYFAFDIPDPSARLSPLFKKVEIDPQKRIFAKDSDIPIKTQAVLCRSFKGGKLP